MNGRKLTLERAATLVLHGNQGNEEETRLREQPKKPVTLARVAWLERRLDFWDSPSFTTALHERFAHQRRESADDKGDAGV
jgi:hypothetical protein